LFIYKKLKSKELV